jgi:DNA-binding transcriptional MerR regulator
VAYKEKEIEKIYYSIGEVATKLNIAPSQIRFWEGEFDIIKPKKNRKGNRIFTSEDIENIKLIYHLVKEKGYTIQGAKDTIKANNKAAKDNMEMLNSLKKIRSFLVEIKQKLG